MWIFHLFMWVYETSIHYFKYTNICTADKSMQEGEEAL